jgi:hypothetical protein
MALTAVVAAEAVLEILVETLLAQQKVMVENLATIQPLHKEIQLQVVVARVAIIVPLVAIQNMVEEGVVEPPKVEIRYLPLAVAVAEEPSQIMVALGDVGQATTQELEEPPLILLKKLATQVLPENLVVVTAVAVEHPVVQVEAQVVMVAQAVCLAVVAVLVE